jgi:class 3 adenylate cyclase
LTEIIEPRIAEFGGQMINWTGERAPIEFDSAVEATRYAALLRDAAAKRDQMPLPEQRIAFRIGINLGDIVLESGDIFGDGVNIAARLAALAEPGSIYVSENLSEARAQRNALMYAGRSPTMPRSDTAMSRAKAPHASTAHCLRAGELRLSKRFPICESSRDL